jgi:hypothetical protein
MRGEVCAVRREGVGRRRRKRRARGKGPTQGLGVQGMRALPSQKGGACDAVRAVRREPEGVGRRRRKRRARGKGPTQGLGVQGTRGAHAEHVDHGRDLGGVKAQRLVEGVRFLPSRRVWSMRYGARCKARRRGAWGGGGLCGMHGEGPTQAGVHGEGPTQGLGGQGTRGAHVEHVAHGRDAGSVKAQRLVEGVRALPSRREGHMRCGARCAPGGRTGCEAVAAQAACTGEGRLKAVGGQGTRGAHKEHAVHGRDLGGVKAQRLVERARLLPKGAACDAGRGAGREAGGCEVAAGGVGRRRRMRHARGKGLTQGLGGHRARAERT